MCIQYICLCRQLSDPKVVEVLRKTALQKKSGFTKKRYVDVTMPLAPVRAPSQWPLSSSVQSFRSVG